jgi:hypothetical protein
LDSIILHKNLFIVESEFRTKYVTVKLLISAVAVGINFQFQTLFSSIVEDSFFNIMVDPLVDDLSNGNFPSKVDCEFVQLLSEVALIIGITSFHSGSSKIETSSNDNAVAQNSIVRDKYFLDVQFLSFDEKISDNANIHIVFILLLYGT